MYASIMKELLNITIIQTALFAEDINKNLDMFDDKIDRMDTPTDLIILPEMFTTGLLKTPEKFAQKMDGQTVAWMRRKAAEKQCAITGSILITENRNRYNRLVFAKADGSIATYDKKHLIRMMGEDKVCTPGDTKTLINLHGWRICPFICYDLRFPVWSRNFNNAYDVAIYVANWPAVRSYHFKVLLVARAIENQCYVAGVNRTGTDQQDISYSGDSCIIDPLGRTMFDASDTRCIHTTELSYPDLQSYRKEFPAWMDADTIENGKCS